MPRQVRLDTPGTLHHVIIRGIERKEIIKDNHDRQNFVYRMGAIALETDLINQKFYTCLDQNLISGGKKLELNILFLFGLYQQ